MNNVIDIRKQQQTLVQSIVFADKLRRDSIADQIADDAAVNRVILSSGYSVGISIRKTDIPNLILALKKAEELWC